MRRILLVAICCLTAVWSWGVPARRDARKVKQADGTVLTVYAHGDEHFSWLTNVEGQWIEQNAEGNYVVVDESRKRAMQHAYRVPEAVQTPVKLNRVPRGLVVLAEFQDVHFSTPKATMDSMLNGQNFSREYSFSYPEEDEIYTIKANGSARKYFETSSFGAFSPKFDVIGPVRVSRNMKYYGENASVRDVHISDFVKEICDMVVALGVDLTKYDADNDGYVDYLGIIFAGYGEADSGDANTIWPHKYEVTYYKEITSQGKTFRLYNCNPEMNAMTGHYMGIGTFCHEFGHILGLPDIYSTDNTTVHKTCGEWDIMDYGCYTNEGDTPPAFTGYERFFMGWATPRLLNAAENVTLRPLIESNEVLMITATGKSNLIGNDPNPNEFYILDNRQQTGFDKHIPGHGMLLTKINYLYATWFGNSVNKKAGDMHIDIIEADGKAPVWDGEGYGWYGRPEDAFPTGANSYNGIKDYPLTDIAEKDGIITFRVKGGVPTDNEKTEAKSEGVRKELRDGRMVIVKDGMVMTPMGITIR